MRSDTVVCKGGKPLTEQQAWAVISVIFQFRTGMCRAIRALEDTGLMGRKGKGATHDTMLGDRMRAQLDATKRRHREYGGGYWFPCDDAGNYWRTEYAFRKAQRAWK